jgi:hypothetical protein
MVSDRDSSEVKLGVNVRTALGWQLREFYRGIAAAATQEEYPARLRELLNRLDPPSGIERAGTAEPESS